MFRTVHDAADSPGERMVGCAQAVHKMLWPIGRWCLDAGLGFQYASKACLDYGSRDWSALPILSAVSYHSRCRLSERNTFVAWLQTHFGMSTAL